MLTRVWQSLRSLMSEPHEVRLLPTCDLSVTDVARIDLLLHALQASRFELVVQTEERHRMGTAVLVAYDARSLTLRLDAVATACGHGNHRVNLVGASTQGLLIFTLDLVRLPGTGLWRGDRPAELMCVQSRRHRRVRIVGDPRTRATLSMLLPFGPVGLLNLSEEGAGLRLAARVDIGTRMGGARLSWDGSTIRIAQVRVCHASRHGDAWHLGVTLEGIGSADQRMLRRWLNEAECRARALI
jgi:hypothetical protein